MICKNMMNLSPWPCFMVFMLLVLVLEPVRSDPQTNLLDQGCSQYNASGDFFNDLNDTFTELRKSLFDKKSHFATAQRSSFDEEPVFVMIQCRNYMSTNDCVKCFDTAAVQIRNCSSAAGARVIYDGCILRYDNNSFYNYTTGPGNGHKCGNRTSPDAVKFNTAVGNLVKDLKLATPKTSDRYAATNTKLSGGGNGSIYGVAQCSDTLTETGCQDCLKVASANIHGCFPNTDARAIDAGCFLRYSTTPFFADNQTVNIRPFLELVSSEKRKVMITRVAIGGVLLIVVACAIFYWYRHFEKEKASRAGNSNKREVINLLAAGGVGLIVLIIGVATGGVGLIVACAILSCCRRRSEKEKASRADYIFSKTMLQGPLWYSYKDLKNATGNFNEENKLGEGGFGKVYKATLKNGNVVAVKKLKVSSTAGMAQFESEVQLISNIHHRNLIRLLGFSSNEAEILLVYEYIKHGSLDIFLYAEKRGTLNWRQRYQIIVGTAKGLAALHGIFHTCIIHRDIKSSNILLDEDFQPKIADFGLARLLPGGHSHLSTRFAGTLGYTAPEYAIYGHLSERVDVYSFGVVILEIISGRRSTDVKFELVAKFLLEEAWNLYRQDMHLKLVDETLDKEEYTQEEVKKVIGVALACIQSPATARPSMSSVVAMLSLDSLVDQRLIGRPAFVDADWTSATDAPIGSLETNATATFT